MLGITLTHYGTKIYSNFSFSAVSNVKFSPGSIISTPKLISCMEPNMPLHITFTQYLGTDFILHDALKDLSPRKTGLKSVKVSTTIVAVMPAIYAHATLISLCSTFNLNKRTEVKVLLPIDGTI
jgi:hypothetical protein